MLILFAEKVRGAFALEAFHILMAKNGGIFAYSTFESLTSCKLAV